MCPDSAYIYLVCVCVDMLHMENVLNVMFNLVAYVKNDSNIVILSV